MKVKFTRLLAKSLPSQESWQGAATFVGHTAAVMRSANVLLNRLGEQIIKQLDLKVDLECFRATTLLGAYLHDWGKANLHFQVMVRLKALEECQSEQDREQQKQLQAFWNSIHQRQMVRHEVLSGILALQVPEFKNWLRQCPNADLNAAVWAAMGHHLKIGGKRGQTTDEITTLSKGTGIELRVFTDHENFTALLKMGVKQLRLPDAFPKISKLIWTTSEIEESLEDLLETFTHFESKIIADNQEYKQFVAATKATVVASDIAGSGLPNVKGNDIEPWIEEVLRLVLSQEEIETLIQQRLKNQSLRDFQKQIAASDRRVTLVRAGCGTGKTVGAYAWAKRHAEGQRLFFCYPTTGTASQGYLDYAAETKIEVKLMHSRAEIDLEAVLFSQEDKHEKNPDNEEGAERIDARLVSFNAWQAKLIVCTVDMVLGLIQNNRKPLYAWPALCQGAFVFDEVHAYDDKLFGALLRFLETFRGAHILLMSASFTEGQLAAIHQLMEKLGEPINEIPGPQNLEKLRRYTLHRVEDATEAWHQVIQELDRKSSNSTKVLWVTNTVNDCIAIYLEAVQKLNSFGIRPLIYHSRFRYKDRLDKHKAVIESFSSDRPVFAVTTQVCEMSLDLSATLLVTAMAPAAAIIQRLGRLNRRKQEEDNITCPAFIYPWQEKNPYLDEELKTGKRLLELLPTGPIRQKDLAEVAAKLSSTTSENISSNWLDGNWRSHPNFLRKPGYTLTVLLEEDLPQIREAAQGNRFGIEAQRWTVPIPIVNSYPQWDKEGVYPVAPSEIVDYSSEIGAQICR